MRVETYIHGRPCPGETESGDAGCVHASGSVTWVLLVDALGHGPEAAKVGIEALDEVRSSFTQELSIDAAMKRLNTRLRGTRGAAATLLRFGSEQIEVTGIGNVELRTLDGDALPYVPGKGILGRRMPRLRSFALKPEHGGRLLLFTDGIERRVPLRDYASRPAAQLAEGLVGEHALARDDAMVVVVDYSP